MPSSLPQNLLQKFSLVVLIFLLFTPAATAQDTPRSQAEPDPTPTRRIIENYDVALEVKPDNTLLVEEKITYNFARQTFNNFSRDIPLDNISIQNVEATSPNNQTSFSTKKDDGQLLIDISTEENKTTSEHIFKGEEVFHINYEVSEICR
jgi:hypothetical protein